MTIVSGNTSIYKYADWLLTNDSILPYSRGTGIQCDQQALYNHTDGHAATCESKEFAAAEGIGKCCDYVAQYARKYNTYTVVLMAYTYMKFKQEQTN